MKIDKKLLEFVFNSLEECVVVIDKDGIITMMSDGFKEFLNNDDVEGKRVEDVISNTGLLITIENGESNIGDVQIINGHKSIVARVPVILNGKIMGAIGKILYKDMDDLEILYNKIYNMEKTNSSYDIIMRQEIYTFNKIIGKSAKLIEAVRFAEKASRGESSVLIMGESGTGKELFAQAIHDASRRGKKPFIKVNCAAIPTELFESEMFGYEEGAFTGAKKSGLVGKFELANGGTILLDEIGDMPMNMQVKLLRVIQEREITRVGGTRPKSIDVRIIASTNKPIMNLIKQGKFREDLYYRLNVMELHVPALRERGDDIELLSQHLRVKLCKKYGIYSEGISKEAMEYLKAYTWPGNIRELENIIERAINLLDTDLMILPKHLPAQIIEEYQKTSLTMENQGGLKQQVDELEKHLIMDAIHKCKGNKKEAAKVLGLSRQGLYKKLNRYESKK